MSVKMREENRAEAIYWRLVRECAREVFTHKKMMPGAIMSRARKIKRSGYCKPENSFEDICHEIKKEISKLKNRT